MSATLATFTSNDWEELGLDINCEDIIEGDHRLLRSLYWGDDDYSSRVKIVLEKILNRDPNYLKNFDKYVPLKHWLKKNDPRSYKELYETNSSIIDDIEETCKINNNVELNNQINRIKRSLEENDTSQSIGSSKELLESVLKTILYDFGQFDTTEDIPCLLKHVQKKLHIDPNDETEKKIDQKLKKTQSNLAQIIIGVAEIRNIAGTGHGRVKNYEIDRNHALLIVNSVWTLSTYLINLWQEQKKIKSKT